MEILREGNNNKIECHGCGNLLKFDISDIRYQSLPPEGPYDLEPSDRYTVTCPSCDTIITVTQKITSSIGRRVLQLEKQRKYTD